MSVEISDVGRTVGSAVALSETVWDIIEEVLTVVVESNELSVELSVGTVVSLLLNVLFLTDTDVDPKGVSTEISVLVDIAPDGTVVKISLIVDAPCDSVDIKIVDNVDVPVVSISDKVVVAPPVNVDGILVVTSDVSIVGNVDCTLPQLFQLLASSSMLLLFFLTQKSFYSF